MVVSFGGTVLPSCRGHAYIKREPQITLRVAPVCGTDGAKSLGLAGCAGTAIGRKTIFYGTRWDFVSLVGIIVI